MSYIDPSQTAYKDGPGLDAFGRLRICESKPLFGLSQEYTYHPLVWDHYTAGTGTATYTQSRNSTILSTAGTASGARALRQTKVYWRYQPGKSQLCKMTGTLKYSGTPTGATYGEFAYGDDRNGIRFGVNATGVYVSIRSDVSGSVVTDRVYQSSWNQDKMDGTGASGITADFTKEQIFVIDFQWLSVGRVRLGLQIGGILYYVHEFKHSNIVTAAYMRTANLPIRAEVFNDGGTGSNFSLETICCSVDSESGTDNTPSYAFGYSAYIATPIAVDTTLRPIVTRRLRDTFNGLTVRGHAHLLEFDLLVQTNPIYWEIRYNPTVTPGAAVVTTTNVDTTYSISEYDTFSAGNLATVSGGVVLWAGIAGTGSGANKINTTISFADSLNILGRTYANARDQYTFCARSITGNASLSLAVRIQEQY